MTINYEPKDIYYPIIESEQRYLVYGSIGFKLGAPPADAMSRIINGCNIIGVAKALVLKILHEDERNSAYCFFGAPPSPIDVRELMKDIIKSLELADRFHFTVSASEILCLKNGCSIRFFNSGKEYDTGRIRSYAGLKTAWIHVDDSFTEEKLQMINPLFRSAQSTLVFSFSTHAGSDFLHGWFYNDFLTKLPEHSIHIL